MEKMDEKGTETMFKNLAVHDWANSLIGKEFEPNEIHDQLVHDLEIKQQQDQRIQKLKKTGISEKYFNTTLDDYVINTEERMKNLGIIREFISAFDTSFNNNLWLCGANGNGKTMLASIIVTELTIKKGLSGIRMVKSYEIEDELEETKNFSAKRTKASVLNDYYTYNLLIIDEVGRFKSETERAFMFRILNERYERNVGTVLITNLSKQELVQFIGNALFDRFCENCTSCEFTEKSFRRH